MITPHATQDILHRILATDRTAGGKMEGNWIRIAPANPEL
jgi:hypothetical protein